MKRLALALALACPIFVQADPLTGFELAKQWSYTALHLADWQQTRRIAGSGGRWIERNPILGAKPTQSQVNRYMASTLALHWLVTYSLPTQYRKAWQDNTIVLELAMVHSNWRLGISMGF